MDEYKSMIKITADTSEVDKKLDELKSKAKDTQKEISKVDAIKALKTEVKKQNKALFVSQAKEQLKDIAKQAFGIEKENNWVKDIHKFTTDTVKNFINTVFDANSIKDIFKNTIDDLVDTAKYDLSNTLISDSSIREQQLTYGLSASQNYAFANTKDMLGIQSDEDLMFMNSKQQSKFKELMQWYGDKYNEWQKSGILQDLQSFSIEFKQFKTEAKAEIASFFVQNKDLLKESMSIMINGMPYIVKGISSLVSIATRIVQAMGFEYNNASTSAFESYRLVNSSSVSNNKTVNAVFNNNITTNNENISSITSVFNQGIRYLKRA